MFSFHLLIVGKQKSGPLQELCLHYQTLLRPYARITITEIPEIRFDSAADRPRVLKKEAESIRNALSKDTFPILLDAEGASFSSEQFAKQIENWSEHGQQPLAFIIGSPLGIDDELKRSIPTRLSLSSLTFPHDLARVMLMEQLYRAMTIQNGKTYHY